MSIPHNVTHSGIINMVINNRPYQVTPDHDNYASICRGLTTATPDEMLSLLDVNAALKQAAKTISKVTDVIHVVDDEVMFLNRDDEYEEIPKVVADRIMAWRKTGSNPTHIAAFVEKLMDNPSFNSRQQLYSFLENKNLAITEEGNILAYKAIRHDWTDKYSGKVCNKIGSFVSMDRGKVDDQPSNHCSAGFHAGSIEYVMGFGHGSDRTVIVEIDPGDVVSVPNDCNCQKLRCCAYKVVGEYDKPLDDDAVYKDHTQKAAGSYNEWEDDLFDENFDFDDPSDEDIEEYLEGITVSGDTTSEDTTEEKPTFWSITRKILGR